MSLLNRYEIVWSLVLVGWCVGWLVPLLSLSVPDIINHRVCSTLPVLPPPKDSQPLGQCFGNGSSPAPEFNHRETQWIHHHDISWNGGGHRDQCEEGQHAHPHRTILLSTTRGVSRPAMPKYQLQEQWTSADPDAQPSGRQSFGALLPGGESLPDTGQQ